MQVSGLSKCGHTYLAYCRSLVIDYSPLPSYASNIDIPRVALFSHEAQCLCHLLTLVAAADVSSGVSLSRYLSFRLIDWS